MEKNKLIRTFICIDFPDEVVKEVARVQEEVVKKGFQGKITELENLHLTLKFLGEIDEAKLAEVRKRLSKVNFKEMNLTLGEVGLFKIRGNPRIVWAKVNGKGIFELQKKIDSVLEGIYTPEERFMSHLTIARIKHVKNRKEFESDVGSIKPKEVSFRIDRFKLKKSELKRLGPVYETLEEFAGS